MDKETENLYDNDTSLLTMGQPRLKPFIVVTDWWYENILHLLNYCQMRARGWDIEDVPKTEEYPLGLKPIPPDFRMMAKLIDLDLLDDNGLSYSQHSMSIKHKKLWRFKWFIKRLWRSIYQRERYKLDKYWMDRYNNPEVNK